MKLTKIISEIFQVGGKVKVIKQDSSRQDMFLVEFPGGEKEWFYYGGYWASGEGGGTWSIYSPNLQEIQEYKDLFKKYHIKAYDKLNAVDPKQFYFTDEVVEWPKDNPNIHRFSPKEQEWRKERGLDEIKNIKQIQLYPVPGGGLKEYYFKISDSKIEIEKSGIYDDEFYIDNNSKDECDDVINYLKENNIDYRIEDADAHIPIIYIHKRYLKYNFPNLDEIKQLVKLQLRHNIRNTMYFNEPGFNVYLERSKSFPKYFFVTNNYKEDIARVEDYLKKYNIDYFNNPYTESIYINEKHFKLAESINEIKQLPKFNSLGELIVIVNQDKQIKELLLRKLLLHTKWQNSFMSFMSEDIIYHNKDKEYLWYDDSDNGFIITNHPKTIFSSSKPKTIEFLGIKFYLNFI
jgi:glutaredoxin-related protein